MQGDKTVLDPSNRVKLRPVSRPEHGRTGAPDGTGGPSREKRTRNWEGENKPGSILSVGL